ncbi:MAG: TonB family protein [Candidatus Omnitrophica bacterium]|nr:TonB family protein [Candidatus Omnitrophota bacterium]
MYKKVDPFQVTFIFSLILHAVFLTPFFSFDFSKQANLSALSVQYFAQINQTPGQPVYSKKNTANSKKDNVKMAKRHPDSAKIKKEILKIKNSSTVAAKKNEIEIKSEENYVVKTDSKEPDKEIQNYFQIVNEQLRYSLVYPRYFSEGEIALSFVLNSSGLLESVNILSEDGADSYLREAAMQIVQNAAPFPPFPPDLKKSRLTFNVVICFREHN